MTDPTYCEKSDVQKWLQVEEDISIIDDFILDNEDYIDSETMHSWRESTITDETHHIDIPAYERRETEIFLSHRKIRDLDSDEGDKLEVWNGSEWENYLSTRTEGRNNDFWLDYDLGILFLKTYPRRWRKFSVRITYRYGNGFVPRQIKRCCVLLTASDVLESDDETVVIPEGGDRDLIVSKIKRWREQAEKIIQSNREQIMGVL